MMLSRLVCTVLLFSAALFFSGCKKCTTCKVANDGSGNEFTYPEYCSRKKADLEAFKDGVKNQANRTQTQYSCNDK